MIRLDPVRYEEATEIRKMKAVLYPFGIEI